MVRRRRKQLDIMEIHGRFNYKSPLWNVCGMFWAVLLITSVFKFSCADPVVVYEQSHRRFIVTEDTFIYSEFGDYCAKIGAEIAELANNDEFSRIRSGVYNNATTRSQMIYIFTIARMNYWNELNFYWTSEIVLDAYWWSGEPNNLGQQPAGQAVSQCTGWSYVCRPTAMTCQYPGFQHTKEAFLFDTCCHRLNPGLCVQDIDECASPERHSCPNNTECVNQQYSYICQCQSGYESDLGSAACVDIDECTRGIDRCPVSSTCVNENGGFTCECQRGYEFDSTACVDIDECASPERHSCPNNTECVNQQYSYICQCQSGYESDLGGAGCVDIDECTRGIDRCPVSSTCVNENGGFTCECQRGYEFDSTACVDVDECVKPGVCTANSTCENTVGGYSCNCDAGFIKESRECVDVDECVKPDVCTANSTCENTVGGYSCNCDAGFIKESRECVDVDECVKPDVCTANSTCENTVGGYSCNCDAGFIKESRECVDVDECEDPNMFSCPGNSYCVNMAGKYTCECLAGYLDLGLGCEDIDECENSTRLLSTCPSHSFCVNLNGTYDCQCDDSYFKNEIGLCEEVPKDSFKLRTCPCVCPALVEEVLNNLPDAKESSDTIQKELEVKPDKLATTVRKKVSASDERGSSASFGIIALTLLGLEFFLVTIGDLITVVFFVKQKLGQLICTRV